MCSESQHVAKSTIRDRLYALWLAVTFFDLQIIRSIYFYRLFLMLQPFPVESKGIRWKKLQEVYFVFHQSYFRRHVYSLSVGGVSIVVSILEACLYQSYFLDYVSFHLHPLFIMDYVSLLLPCVTFSHYCDRQCPQQWLFLLYGCLLSALLLVLIH